MVFSSKQAGIVRLDLATVIGVANLVNDGAAFRTVEGNVGTSIGHDTRLLLVRLFLTDGAERAIFIAG